MLRSQTGTRSADCQAVGSLDPLAHGDLAAVMAAWLPLPDATKASNLATTRAIYDQKHGSSGPRARSHQDPRKRLPRSRCSEWQEWKFDPSAAHHQFSACRFPGLHPSQQIDDSIVRIPCSCTPGSVQALMVGSARHSLVRGASVSGQFVSTPHRSPFSPD